MKLGNTVAEYLTSIVVPAIERFRADPASVDRGAAAANALNHVLDYACEEKGKKAFEACKAQHEAALPKLAKIRLLSNRLKHAKGKPDVGTALTYGDADFTWEQAHFTYAEARTVIVWPMDDLDIAEPLLTLLDAGLAYWKAYVAESRPPTSKVP